MNSERFPDPLDLFPPTREAALERLADFVPRAGRHYAKTRNADPGPGLRDNVSMLSPYLRHRVITEREVVAAVLAEHTPNQAGKFIDEVLWRTYFKGWLQMRPRVWRDFRDEVDTDRERVADDPEIEKALERAETGRTGIDCFDDWARELVATGYLHNHVRMWFASIWIFTLKLPWALGADFFIRHLLDGDPASNTLSWRWVAGIQTPGKTYRARPGNIEKFTNGRYRPDGLAEDAPAIRDEKPPEAGEIDASDDVEIGTRVVVLLHGDDLRGYEALPEGLDIGAVLVARGGHADASWPFGDKARRFVAAAAADAARYATEAAGVEAELVDMLMADPLIERARAADADVIVTADAPVGPIRYGLDAMEPALNGAGLKLRRLRRDWDEAAWPKATKGFFAFKKHIPALLERAGVG